MQRPNIDMRKQLRFVYWIMLATDGLLEEAAKRSEGELKAYFENHREEERTPRDHPAWMREDLERLGLDLSEPDYTAAAIAGSQYYLIKHVNPAYLLSYSYVLESAPKPLEWVKEWEKELGGSLPCLRYHAEHDPHHVRDILAQIEKLPEGLRKDIMRNAEQVTTWLISRG